ncbi:calcium-binding protein, partial [Vulcanococcus limneticus]|uniref:calcium-binding protein n=1 Tax=Vulcanococcus limneticus TaxID=2170428 RepID=UPI00398C2175
MLLAGPDLSAELATWQLQLQALALNGALAQAAQSALLLDERAQGELEAWLSLLAVGDFSTLPPIEALDGSAMPGAAGAYAASTGTIYLNTSWLDIASSEQVSAVLCEELGHWLDSWLNGSDTQGDEGELFAALLLGQIVSREEFQRIAIEDDQLTITVASGEVVKAEASKINGSEADDTLTGDGLNNDIYGYGGNDSINAEAGADLIDGGDGNDIIDGSFGNDTLFGGSGDDQLTDSQGSNLLDGGDGFDTLTSKALSG